MRVHRNVGVLKARDGAAMAELKVVLPLNGAVLKEMGDSALVLHPEKVERLLREMVKGGYSPKVVDR